MKRPFILGLFGMTVAALMLIVGCWVYGAFAVPEIPPHRGDGEFKNISNRSGPFVVRGYTIRFDELDLSERHSRRYRFAAMPSIGLRCVLYFLIRDPDARIVRREEVRFTKGRVGLRLSNSAGTVIREMTGSPSDFVWSRFGKSQEHLLYQLKSSFFDPDSTEEYTLELSYAPEPALAGFKGLAYIQCGGVK